MPVDPSAQKEPHPSEASEITPIVTPLDPPSESCNSDDIILAKLPKLMKSRVIKFCKF